MTEKDLRRLAALGKLEFSDAELAEFSKEFNAILKFVSAIENSNIDGESFLPRVEFASLRPDEVRKSLPQDKVLLNAPESDGEYFITPQVVE